MAASKPPINGPTTDPGITPIAGSLPVNGKDGMGQPGAQISGGLIAYPVGPPREIPTERTIKPTKTGPKPVSNPESGTRLSGRRMVSTPNTRTKVPTISEIKLERV